MIPHLKPVLSALIASVFSASALAQSNVYWNFGTADPGQATPTSGVPTGIAFGAVAQGNNNGTTTLLTTSSPSSGYSGASGSFNAGAAARTGALNTNAAGSAYFEFSATPDPGVAFTVTSVSFGSRSTGTGPASYALRSSTDAYASDLAAGALTTNGSWTFRSNSVSAAQQSSAVTYRLYGFGGAGTPTAGTANWRIDDLTITVNAAAVGPSVSVSTNSLGGFTATQGTPSVGTNFFTATGANLSNNITVAVPGPNFQISTNTNSSFFTNAFDLPSNASATPIYVRLTGFTNGSFTTNVSLTSGTNSTNVSVTGTVVPPPSLTALPSTLSGLTATQGIAGVSTNFTVGGTNLAGSITVTANDPTNFAISSNNVAFTNILTLPTNNSGAVTNTPVFVRLTGTNLGSFTNTVTASTPGAAATTNVTVSGTVVPPPPSISVSTNTLSVFNTVQPNPSGAQTFNVSGSNLTANVTVTPPAGFQVSTNGTTFSNSLTLVPSGATLAATPVSVRLIGASSGSFSGDVNVTSTGASPQAVAVSGNVAAAGSPSIEPGNGFAVTGFQAIIPDASGFQQITVSGTNLTAPITITPPPGWQISATNNSNPVSSLIVLATNPAQIVSNTPVFIRIAPGQTTPTTLISNALTLVSGSLTNTVFLSGSVINPPPSLSVSNPMTNFSTTSLSNTSDVQSFTASGTFLTSNITVTSSNSNDFEISLTNNAGWGSVLELTNNGTVNSRPVFVRMTGKTAGANNGIIGLVSGSASTNVSVNGTVPAPLITLNTNVVSGFNTQAGTASAISNVVVTSANLGTNSIAVVSTNSAYEISTNSFATAAASLTLPPAGGTVAVRIAASATATNSLPGRLVFSSLGYSTNATLAGSVTAPAAVTLTMPGSIAQGNPDVGTVSLSSVPVSNVVVTLTCSAPSLMTIPATVVVPAGTNSVEFDIQTSGGAPTTSVTTIALAAGYAQGSATTVLDGDGSIASFTATGYQQTFSNFLSQATLPVGWSVDAAGSDVYSAWGSGTALSVKHSVTGTNVFGFQHTSATDTNAALQILTLRNDTGATLQTLAISYRGRTTRTNETRTPSYVSTTVIGTNTITNTSLAYTTAGTNPDNQLRTGTNTNIRIPPGGTFQLVWSSGRGSNTGSSRTIGISDVRLTSSITPVPSITATPSSISGFSTTAGTNSAPLVSFVSGTNLATNITVTPPAGFELSTNFASGFGTNPLALLQTAGAVPQTPLYFRVADTVAPGVLGGSASLVSTNGTNDAMATILLSAMVFSNTPTAQVLTDKTSLSGFSTPSPTDSAPQTFQVSGINLSNNPVNLQVSGDFTLSLDNSAYTNNLSLPSSGGALFPTLVYVRMIGAVPGPKSGDVAVSSPGASTRNVALSGLVDPPLPIITVNTSNMPTSVPQFVTPQGRPSAAGLLRATATNLTTNVTVSAPPGFEVAAAEPGPYAGSLPIGFAGGGFSNVPVYVRLTGADRNTYAGDVVFASGIVTTNIPVTGVVTNALQPSITLTAPPFTNFVSIEGVPSAPQTFEITAGNVLTNVVVTAPQYFEVRDPDQPLVGFGPSVSLRPVNYTIATKSLEVRMADSAPVTTNETGLTGTIIPTTEFLGSTFEGNSLGVQGFVSSNSSPFVYADPKVLTGFEAVPGGSSPSQSFAVVGSNLSAGVSVFAPAGYEVSTASNSGFANTVQLAASVPGALAQDLGANYASSPTTGSNGGVGFKPWTIITAKATNGFSGIFAPANPADAGIGGMASNSFGLFANPASTNNSVVARREFNAALEAGQSFALQWGNNFEPGSIGSKGVTLLAGTNPLITVAMAGASPNITVRQGTNAPITALTNYGTNAINVIFSRTNSSNIQVIIPRGRDGGAGFTNSFTVTNMPTGFELFARALQGGPPDENRIKAQPYFNNLVVTTNGGATAAAVGPTNVFVRLAPGAAQSAGPLLGTATLSSPGASNKFVSLQGTVYGVATISVSPTVLGGFSTVTGSNSASQSFQVTGSNLNTAVAVSAGGGFEISASPLAGFTNSLTLATSGAPGLSLSNVPVWVRVAASSPVGNVSNSIALTAGGFAGQNASNNVSASGTVYATGGSPQIAPPVPAAITNLETIRNVASEPSQFVVSGANLASAIIATASANYELASSPAGPFGGTLTITPDAGGSVNFVTNYVRIAATAPQTNSLTGTVNLFSTGAAGQSLSLVGAVLPPPGLVTSPTSVTNLWTVQGFQSSPSSFSVTASNLQGPVTVSAVPPLLVSAGGAFESTAVLDNRPGGTVSATVSVVISSNAQAGTVTNANGITFSSPNATGLPSVETVHTVALRPDIIVSTNALTNFTTVVGNPSDPPKTFTVSGTNLLTNIFLVMTGAVPGIADKYEMTTNASVATAWSNRITLVPDYSGTAPGPPVIVAQDNAANYGVPGASTWTNGANGGNGFGPWAVVLSNGAGFFAGQFLGDPNSAGISAFGTNAFGLFANPLGSAAFVRVDRELVPPLQVGDTFSFQWAINWDSGAGGNKGFVVYAGGPGTNQIVNVNNAGSDVITFNGTNTGFGFGTTPMTWSFFYSNATTLVVTANDRDGSGVFTTNLTVAAAPRSVRFYASAMQGADNAQPYFNNFLVTRPGPTVPTGGVVSNTAVSVRLKAAAPVGAAAQQIDLTSDNTYTAPETVTLNGQVLPKPVFTVTPPAITTLFTVTNTPSSPGTFTVNASNLIGNIAVTAPAGVPAPFEISTNSLSGYTNVLSLAPGTNGALSNLSVYVRIAAWPTVAQLSGTVAFSNRFAATEVSNVPVAGDVLAANPGGLRAGFVPPSANGAVEAVAATSSNAFYIGGNFTSLVRTNGTAVVTNNFRRVARLLTDGTVDTGFDPGAGPDAEVSSLLFSPSEDALYIGGAFTSVGGAVQRGIARLKADGSRDTNFAPVLTAAAGLAAPTVNAILRQHDGKIVIGGQFATVNGVPAANVARLTPDGQVEASFRPNPSAMVNALALQPDGKIVVGGEFAQVGGVASRGVARLSADGSLDRTFVVGEAGFNGPVATLGVLPDGHVLVGGAFFSYRNSPFYNGLAKLGPDGSLVAAFNYATGTATGGFSAPVSTLQLRPNGLVMAGGDFASFNTRPAGHIVRLLPDGSRDPRFNPGGVGADQYVADSATLANGDLVVVGGFTTYDDQPCDKIAVLAGSDGLTPIITSPSFATVNAGQPLNFAFTSTAAPPLTYALDGVPAPNPAVLPMGVAFANTGVLSGVPMSAGTFPLTVTVVPQTGLPSAPTPFTLYVVDSPVSYQQWVSAWFTPAEQTNSAVSGPAVSMGNPSGLNNFAVYALSGGNPRTLGPSIVPTAEPVLNVLDGETYLTMTVDRNPLAQAAFTPQFSTNLLTPWLSGSNALTIFDVQPGQFKVRPNTPMFEDQDQFLRLRIEGGAPAP